MTTKALRDALSRTEVVITFIKKDGSERVMRATTNLDVIPYTFKTKISENTDKKPKSTNLLHVWDLDIKEWRSIREQSITSWDLSE